MKEVLESIEIDKPKNYVFELAQDYGLRLKWDPFLKDISFVSKDKSLQRGLQVWVKAHNGMKMTVEYLNYTPPDHVSMKMIDGPFLFKVFSGLWKFENISENKTLVIFKYKFNTKLLFKLGDMITKWILSRDMKKRLSALKKGTESGNFDHLILNKAESKIA